MLLDDLKTFLAEIVRTEVEQALAKRGTKQVPLLVDINGAAELLSLPSSWIANAARRGDLPSVKMGHHVRFQVSELEKFIEQENVKVPAPRKIK
jgi:excisionase family DNA binding protein